MSISIIVPTYRRPASIARFAEHAFRTCSGTHPVEILFGCKDDDVESHKAVAALPSTPMLEVRKIDLQYPSDGQPHLTKFWNETCRHAKYEIFGHFDDDVVFRTKNWDDFVMKEFRQDPLLLIYGDDVHVLKGQFATHFFTHKKFHDAIGYYLNDSFRRWFMDTFMDVVFRKAGKLRYFPDLVLEHVHPLAFSGARDEVFVKLTRLTERDTAFWKTMTCKREIVRCIKVLRDLEAAVQGTEKCKRAHVRLPKGHGLPETYDVPDGNNQLP